jgi:transposase-like protein
MARIHQMTIPQFEALFPNEDACAAYLVSRRWPDGVHCPRCGSVRVYALTTMAFKWECPDCRQGGAYRFSHISGTVFENTNKPLREWFRVIHMMLTSKKGISALQVQRMMGFGSYRTAWHMCHRIRAALVEQDFQQLMGIVEVDETYVGGKNSNRHWDKKRKGMGGEGSGKDIVIGAVQRKTGNTVSRVVARVIANTRTETFEGFVREAVSTNVSLLATDEHSGYRRLAGAYPHKAVRHQAGSYVVGAVHTNTLEGFWSILKRGVVGTFHKVSAKYLPLYVAEFEFRYNNRENDDIFGAAIKAC